MMITVKAIYPFEHGGRRRRNDEFEVVERVAVQLQKKGLVAILSPLSAPESDEPTAKPAASRRNARSAQGG